MFFAAERKRYTSVFLVFFVIALPVFFSKDFEVIAAELVNEVDAEAANVSSPEGILVIVLGVVDVAKTLGVENVVDVEGDGASLFFQKLFAQAKVHLVLRQISSLHFHFR